MFSKELLSIGSETAKGEKGIKWKISFLLARTLKSRLEYLLFRFLCARTVRAPCAGESGTGNASIREKHFLSAGETPTTRLGLLSRNKRFPSFLPSDFF